MAYTRKTKDVYNIVTNYGYGWEFECTEETYKEAKQRLKEYRDNTTAQIKLEKKRERL